MIFYFLQGMVKLASFYLDTAGFQSQINVTTPLYKMYYNAAKSFKHAHFGGACAVAGLAVQTLLNGIFADLQACGYLGKHLDHRKCFLVLLSLIVQNSVKAKAIFVKHILNQEKSSFSKPTGCPILTLFQFYFSEIFAKSIKLIFKNFSLSSKYLAFSSRPTQLLQSNSKNQYFYITI